MSLIVFNNVNELADAAAEMIAALLQDGITQRGEAHIALSGGSTPGPVYERLSREPLRGQIPWPQIHVWWADERCVPPDDRGSNYRLARESLLDQVPIPPDQVHRVLGEWPPEEAAADYAAQLRTAAPAGGAWPRLDAVLLGLGGDGHTASLFPGEITDEELTRPVLAVKVAYEDRPAQRVTLTPVVLNAARHIIFLVTGSGKAPILAGVLARQDLDPQTYPVHRIQPQAGTLTWLVDRQAARDLTAEQSPPSARALRGDSS